MKFTGYWEDGIASYPTNGPTEGEDLLAEIEAHLESLEPGTHVVITLDLIVWRP